MTTPEEAAKNATPEQVKAARESVQRQADENLAKVSKDWQQRAVDRLGNKK